MNPYALQAGLFVAVAGTAIAPSLAQDGHAYTPSKISVSPDGRYLADAAGDPFFWLADTSWDLVRALTFDETKIYLDDRARRGFTVIQAAMVFGGYGTPPALTGRNRDGEAPFLGIDPTRPNPNYFAHVDRVIEYAGRKGLRLALHPLWAANFVPDVTGPLEILTPESARAYGKWLGNRYRGKNVIWVLGGDYNPVGPHNARGWAGEVKDFRPIWDAMAEGIANGERADPFITYHPTPLIVDGVAEPRTSLFLSRKPWLDMNMIQSGHVAPSGSDWAGGYLSAGDKGEFVSPYNYDIIAKEYWSRPVRPVIDFEVRYEHSPGCIPRLPRTPCWDAHAVRGVAYRSVFAGAAGHSYGNSSLWDLFDPARSRKIADYELKGSSIPWQTALNAEGGNQMRHLRALMLSRPYFERIPDQSVIRGFDGEGDRHIAATRSRAGSYMMIYIPQGQEIVIDLTKMSGSAAVAWWFDPRTGRSVKVIDHLPTNDRRAFFPPSAGEKDDWVLVVDDEEQHFDPPGSLLRSRFRIPARQAERLPAPR